MRAQLTPGSDGAHDLAVFDGGACIASIPGLDDHAIDDLIAALTELQAMTRTCGRISDDGLGDHTCWLPPDHTAPAHACRACPHTWSAP